MDKLPEIWKFALLNNMKRDFFQAIELSVLLYDKNNMDTDETIVEKR